MEDASMVALGAVSAVERSQSTRSRGGAAAPIEIDPKTGALMQGGHKLHLRGEELIRALRKALAAEHAKSSAIVDALSEPIVIFGPDCTLEWSNPHAEFTFGATAVVRGTPCHLLICDRAEPCHECPVRAFAAQERNPGTVRLRHEVKTSEGFAQPFELTLRRIQTTQREPSSMVLLRDIGDQSAREVRLRERLKRDDLRLELSDIMLSSRTLAETVTRFADRAGEALQLCTIAVLLRTSDGWLVPARVLHYGEVQEGFEGLLASSSLGIKPVFASRQALLVRDVDKSGRALSIAAVLERAPRAGSGSMVLAPLIGRSGEMIGALVTGRVEVDGFEQEDVELIEALARRLGHAVDAALIAEASARVTRLQEALIDQAEIIAAGITDYTEATRRVLERLANGTGISLAAAVLIDPHDRAVRLFQMYTADGGFQGVGSAAHPLKSCTFMTEMARRSEVVVRHSSTMLPSERSDPVLARLLEEGDRQFAFVPASMDGQVFGWFALGALDPLAFSSPGEVEVLRNLAQQTQIALSWIASDGQVEAMLEELQRQPRSKT